MGESWPDFMARLGKISITRRLRPVDQGMLANMESEAVATPESPAAAFLDAIHAGNQALACATTRRPHGFGPIQHPPHER